MKRCKRGKVCHPTIEAACRHAVGLQERDRRRGIEPRAGWTLEPYWCEAHQCYHIGHRRVITIEANQPIEETIS